MKNRKFIPSARLPERRIYARPDMNDPPQKHKPECPGREKKQNGGKNSSLDQLSQTGKKEAAKGCYHVSSGSTSRAHEVIFSREPTRSASDSEYAYPGFR